MYVYLVSYLVLLEPLLSCLHRGQYLKGGEGEGEEEGEREWDWSLGIDTTITIAKSG